MIGYVEFHDAADGYEHIITFSNVLPHYYYYFDLLS